MLFIRADHLGIVDREGGVDGPPDMVAEVLSPPNRDYDRNLKRTHYLENGVSELWILDADGRTVEVWKPGASEAEQVRDVLEWRVAGHRFEVQLEEVFRS